MKKSGSYHNRNRTVQRYACLRCGKTFSESQPLDGMRIEHAKVVQIVKLLAEGLGVRACARLTDCHQRTVLAVLETVGQKCDEFHNRVVRELQVGSIQIDELWARTFCSQKRAVQKSYGDEAGDQYTYLALTGRERFIVSYHTGKRDVENTDAFVADVAERITGRIQITTDAFAAYPAVIRSYLLDRLDYAVMQKKFALPANYVDAARRYSPAPFTGVRIRVKAGAPRPDRICTSHVERCNLDGAPLQQTLCPALPWLFQDADESQARDQSVCRGLQLLQGSFDTRHNARARRQAYRPALDDRGIDREGVSNNLVPHDRIFRTPTA